MGIKSDKEERGVIVSVLDNIINGELSKIYEEEGLCGNLIYELRSLGANTPRAVELVCSLVESISPSWEYFSGDASFPVPDTEGKSFLSPVQAYFESDKWKGEQLELRQSLSQHIKDCLLEEKL